MYVLKCPFRARPVWVSLTESATVQLTAMASCEIAGCPNAPRQWQREGREGYYKRCWAHRDAVDESAGYKLCAVAGCVARVKYETCWAHRETAVFKKCDTCGQSFPAPVWKKTCVPCFSAKKRTPAPRVLAALSSRLVAAARVTRSMTPRQPPEEVPPPGPRVTAADMDNLLATSSPAPAVPPPLTS